MLLLILASILVTGGLCSSVPAPPPQPTFPKIYTAEGEIRLPYAEIVEPFKAYYDETNNRSRLDYYGDTVVTIQRPDLKPYGVNLKVVYTHQTVRNCFQVNGTANNTIGDIQSVFPDLTQFNYTYNGEASLNNESYDVWQALNRDDNGPEKLNTYKLYMSKGKNPVPVKFQMMGFNIIFGSHYDKYEINYFNVKAQTKIDESVFQIKDMKCTSFPGPGHMLFNPMKEFINIDDSHVEDGFDDFKDKHGKTYSDEKEHEIRKNNFKHNLRYINSKNREGNSFTLGVNHLADKSDNEIRVLRGKQKYNGQYNGGLPMPDHDTSSIPDVLDWRLYGAVTPVKDQAVCGSCWSFGTTGAIEGEYFVHSGHLLRLSQQALIDCSWTYGNNGCDGGEDYRAYQWIMNGTGLPLADEYGAYLGQDGICADDKLKQMKSVKISGYVNITTNDLKALRVAMFHHGPISVSIDASHKSFSFYSNGVYYEPKCKNGIDDLDHLVLAVGYGEINEEKYWLIKNSWSTYWGNDGYVLMRNDVDGLDHSVLAVGFGIMEGERYWLVKNSWSTYWGNDGYVLMSQKDNNCGVATQATYVTFD